MHPHPFPRLPILAQAASVFALFAPGISLAADETDALEFKKRVITSDLGGLELAFLTRANEQGVIMNYLSELAKTKSESEDVRTLGERFATAQAEETNHLIELAAGKGVNFKAQTPPAIKKINSRLTPFSGTAFDKACVAELAALTRIILANYEAGARCKDAEIQAFAKEGLQLAQEQCKAADKKLEALRTPPE